MEGISVLVVVRKAGQPCFEIEVTRFPSPSAPRRSVTWSSTTLREPQARGRDLSRGQLSFADSSSNGSFWRGQRITSRLLESGDEIEIPPFELSFELEVEQTESGGPPARSRRARLSELRSGCAVRAAQPPAGVATVPRPCRQPDPDPREDVFGPPAATTPRPQSGRHRAASS